MGRDGGGGVWREWNCSWQWVNGKTANKQTGVWEKREGQTRKHYGTENTKMPSQSQTRKALHKRKRQKEGKRKIGNARNEMLMRRFNKWNWCVIKNTKTKRNPSNQLLLPPHFSSTFSSSFSTDPFLLLSFLPAAISFLPSRRRRLRHRQRGEKRVVK